MVLKLLTPTELKVANEKERTKEIARLDSVRNALSNAQKQLNESDAKFALMLANQQKRWAKEEGEAAERLGELHGQIMVEEKRLAELRIPIDDERKKAHDLFIQAEAVLLDAKEKQREVDTLKASNERQAEQLQDRLDELSGHATDLDEREQQVQIREEAVLKERDMIKTLSKDLTDKLNLLWHKQA